jgi:predicted nucleic acid-binding protein
MHLGCNTSPIIALSGIGRLALMGSMFERVIVPFEDFLSRSRPGQTA